jgi:hypothetical protein
LQSTFNEASFDDVVQNSIDEEIINFNMKPGIVDIKNSAPLCKRCRNSIAEWICGNSNCQAVLFCPVCYSDYKNTGIYYLCPVCRKDSKFVNYIYEVQSEKINTVSEKESVDAINENQAKNMDGQNYDVELCKNCTEIAEFRCSKDECQAICFCRDCYKKHQNSDLVNRCPVCSNNTLFYNYLDEEFGNNDEYYIDFEENEDI